MNLQKDWQADNPTANRLTWVLCTIYLLALFWILVLKMGVQFSYMGNREVNLIPFREHLINNGKADLAEVMMNVVVFVPLGIYAGVLFETWTFRKKLFFFFQISLLVEAVQFIMAVGAFDTTDIVTNTAGAILGLGIFRVIKKVCRSSVRAQKLINLIAVTVTSCMVVLLVLLKLDMLPIRYR